MHIARLASLSLLLVSFGCGSDEAGSFSADDIVARAPQGLMNGAPWTMTSAIVDDDGEELSISLFPTEVAACDRFSSSDTEIMFIVPKLPGEYPLSFSFESLSSSRVVTFVTGPGQNVIAADGVIVVDAVSDESVTIGLVAEAGDNSINGRFTSPVCADDR